MPEFKQPPPLLKIATDRLVYSLAQRCNECSISRSLDKLRQVVAVIKEDIGPKIPWHIEADFFETFLCRYFYGFQPCEERPESDKRAVLEVIMDRKILGLGWRVSYLLDSMYLEDEYVHRIRGFSTLELTGYRRYNLETFHLEDLTKFVYLDRCTDADLQIIAENCPKLDHLSIVSSKQLTDKGLVALNKCTKLRIVFVRYCRNITNRGIHELLSAHEKIEKIDFDFQCFSEEGWSVYPSITHYEVDLDDMTNSNLRLIAERFPNLTSLKIAGELNDSVCLTSTLGSLKQLKNLHFEPVGYVIIWDDLKRLLRPIGANITGLHISSFCSSASIGISATQADLDFLHKFCPNIESLDFHYNAKADGQTLVIPPFGCLRKFTCSNSSDHPDYARLQFGVMAELQSLEIRKVEVTAEDVESMILDNDKFPVLNSIGVFKVSSDYDPDRIKEIVKNNNIDLRVEENECVLLRNESGKFY